MEMVITTILKFVKYKCSILNLYTCVDVVYLLFRICSNECINIRTIRWMEE